MQKASTDATLCVVTVDAFFNERGTLKLWFHWLYRYLHWQVLFHGHPTAASVDSLDWKELAVEDIVTRVTKRVKPGSIMLFHNGAKNTPAALPQVIEKLQTEGYKFVKATELLLPEPTEINHQGTQKAVQKSEDPSEGESASE